MKREPGANLHVRRRVAIAMFVALTLVALVGIVLVTRTGSNGSTVTVNVSDNVCAGGWQAPRSGVRVFNVHNESRTAADVDLVGAVRPRVYGSLEVIAAGATRTLTVRLPPGRYQWRCGLASGASVLSRAVTVTGPPVRGVQAAETVTLDDLTPVAVPVRADTTADLAVLATDADTLRAAVDAGRIEDAKAIWLTAHLDYERLGVVYGTFGDFDAKIDGRPDGLPGGTSDPDWTGFLRLERALWDGESPAVLPAIADRLDADVHALVADFPNEFTDVRDVPLRVHEILENTLQFVLTGDSDQGSHTELATARANVDGTRDALAAVAPLLRSRAPSLLAAATQGLNGFATLLDSHRAADGRWTSLAALTAGQREQLNGTAGALVETLAPIPDVLELPRDAGQD